MFVKLPKILVFHIKRFDSNYRKIEKKTEYGAMLDLEQFCTPNISPQLRGNTEFKLFALTVHMGTLSGGHYISYAKRGDNWFLFNDTQF